MVIKLEKILGLDDGEHRYSFETTATAIGLDNKDFEGNPVFGEPVLTEVTLTKTNHVFYIKLKAVTDARFPCDRCLEEVHHPIEGAYEVVYTDLKSRAEETRDSEDIRLIDVQNNEIGLDKDVSDTVRLNLPMKVLCRENCKGLCVECGINLNTETCEHSRELMEK